LDTEALFCAPAVNDKIQYEIKKNFFIIGNSSLIGKRFSGFTFYKISVHMFTYMVFFCYREQIPDAQPRRKQLNVTSSLKDQKYAVKLIELSAIKKPVPV
jgi:hypothetical protein